MSNAKSVFSGLFWKFSERLSAQGVSFIVSIILARILMPEDYGIVAMVNIFITIADVFVVSGFSTALIQNKDADETDFSTILYCSLFVSVLIYFVLFTSAPFIAGFYGLPILVSVIRVFGLRMPLAAYNSVQHAYVSRHMLFKKFFYSTLVGTIASGAVGIAMAYRGFGVWALIGQYFTNSVIDIVVLSFTIDWRPKWMFSASSAKKLMGYGWKILMADLVGTIYQQLRAFIIGKVYSSADLAYYNRGKKFPDLITTNVDGTISSVLFPAMSNYSDNKEQLKIIVSKAVKLSSYIMFPLMIGMAAVSKPVILILLTEKWAEAIPYMQIMCIAGAINSVTNTNLQAMKAMGRSDVVLKLEFYKKPVGLLMIFISVRFGVIAIALTMPLYAVYAALVNMRPNKKLIGYGIKEQIFDLLPAAALSAIMFAAIRCIEYLHISMLPLLIVQVLCGAFVYIIASYILKADAFMYLTGYVKNSLLKRK